VTKADYYEVLGVGRDIDESGLKSAYRKLAMQFHPDRNPGNAEAEERFKAAAEAYSVLSDPNKRAAYDRFGHAGVSNSGGAGGFDPSAFQGFEDIFGEFFNFSDFFGGGGSRRGQRGQRGEDVRYDLTIEFEDALKGKSIEIQVPRLDICSRCNGKGGEPGDGMATCQTCRGRGEVVYQQAFLQIRRACGQCGGRGQVIRKACARCQGEGRTRSDRKLRVSIPPGVDNGTRLRLSEEGQPGANGAPPGDLYVVIRVKEHPVFQRSENDLHCVIPVNVAQAVLGAEIDLLTFDGLQTVTIPEGTGHGSQIRLRGLGVPRVNGRGRGDIIVHVDVRMPKKLTREQRRLFVELRESLPAENVPEDKSLFDKFKDYLAN
jgi:molecular chaperone DnaJ